MKRIKLKIGILAIAILLIVPFFYYLFLYIINPGSPRFASSGMSIGYSNSNSKTSKQIQKFDESQYIGKGNPYLGNLEAPIKIVEFADFQCQFSKQEFAVIRRIVAKYKDKIYFQYRDFPLITIHDRAFELAEAGRCANAQGKFWQFHDRVFLEQGEDLNANLNLQEAGKMSGLDVEKFLACVNNHDFKNAVEFDLKSSVEMGLRGTPSFVVNGYKIEGALPETAWEEIIQALL